jgi:hypothetical protein
MLLSAWELRHQITEYFQLFPDIKYADDHLSTEEYSILNTIKEFLVTLKHTTKALESSSSTLNSSLIGIDYTLGQFKKGKTLWKDHHVLS